MANSDHKLEMLNAMCRDTLMEHLGIEYILRGENFLEARMPVNKTTWQPIKVLHGGATMALAESVGSALSVINTDTSTYVVKGMEINANHVRSVKDGYVTARAEFLHKGRTSHVVEIKVRDDNEKLVSVCRLTNAILKKEAHEG